MKSILFSVLVAVCAYYLLSQTNSGSALVKNWLPGQQIEQASETLLNHVEQRINQLSEQQSAQQNQKITQLEQQLDSVNKQLAELIKQQKLNADLAANQLASSTSSQTVKPSAGQMTNDALNLPPDLSQVQAQTVPATAAVNRQNSHLVNSALRQKQAALQDIAQRMEQVSLQAASGLN